MPEEDTHHEGGQPPPGTSKEPKTAPGAGNGARRHHAPAAAHEPEKKTHAGKKPPAWHDRPALVGFVVLAVVVIAVIGVLWWRHSRTYESTDDAFIDIVAQRVSTQVAGRVLRVPVDDNQDVAAGRVLVELDPADFQIRLEQARAGELQAEAQLAEAEASRVVADVQRDQARARESVAGANATNTATDLRRFRELRTASVGAVAQQQLDHAGTEADSAAAQLREAQLGVTAAEAQMAEADKQIDAARAAVKSAAAQVAQAEQSLSYTQVTASVDGRIARKTVAPGNFVQPGTDLMAVVPRTVYVTANFKETQLARMRRGQPVKIKVDSYPDLELTGRIDSVQPATGQVFDLLPSQNAAGNWVKVVQRVPVKITLDQIPDDPDRRLAPGMSVRVTATVR